MDSFIATAADCETSVEVMRAIATIARTFHEAERIWEEPGDAELLAIWEIVTKNGLLSASDFVWGAAGNQWAEDIER